MSRIEEGRADTGRQLQRLIVTGLAPEIFKAVERIQCRIKRLKVFLTLTVPAFCPAFLVAGLFFLQARCIQQHQTRQFQGRRGRDHFAVKALLRQQRYATAMVKVGMSQQQEIDGCRCKTHRLGIFLDLFAPALVKAAIDQDPLARAFDQVAGAGYVLIGPVEGNFHTTPWQFYWYRASLDSRHRA